jgi:hypothetical protein
MASPLSPRGEGPGVRLTTPRDESIFQLVTMDIRNRLPNVTVIARSVVNTSGQLTTPRAEAICQLGIMDIRNRLPRRNELHHRNEVSGMRLAMT